MGQFSVKISAPTGSILSGIQHQAFIAFVKRTKPAWVIFENVKGILETEGGLFNQIRKDLEYLGYRCEQGLLNAVDFGVPQSRSRFFIIGRLEAVPPSLPSGGEGHKVSVDDALHDLPVLSNGAEEDVLSYAKAAETDYALRMRGDLAECSGHIVSRNAESIIERYPFIPQGGNWADIPEEMMANYCTKTGPAAILVSTADWTRRSPPLS